MAIPYRLVNLKELGGTQSKKEVLELVSSILEFNDLGYNYPNFDKWFEKVSQCVINDDSERQIIIAINLEGKIMGIMILKDEEEKKISTLVVSKRYRKMGIGGRLIEKGFKVLGTIKPVITISEERLDDFQAIIKKYNFELSEEVEGLYKEGVTEYIFNK